MKKPTVLPKKNLTPRLLLTVGALGLVVGGLSLFHHSSPVTTSDQLNRHREEKEQLVPLATAALVVEPQTASLTTGVVPAATGEATETIKTADASIDSGPTPKSSILEKMQSKKKIFKSPEEERELLRMAKDPESFKYGSSYLQNEKNWPTAGFEEEQNALLDLFKMGFEQHTSEAFTQALLVIADNRVEEKSLSVEQRNVLAGMQAELMYQLLSADSSYGQAVQQAAQGPVHLELLKNVNLQLDANYQDSLSEKADHEKSLAAGEPVSI